MRGDEGFHRRGSRGSDRARHRQRAYRAHASRSRAAPCPADRQGLPDRAVAVAKNLIQGIEWAAQHAGETAFVQIHLRLGVYHRRPIRSEGVRRHLWRLHGSRAGSENPVRLIDAAPEQPSQDGPHSPPSMGAIRARRMAEPASPSAAAVSPLRLSGTARVPSTPVDHQMSVEGTRTYNLCRTRLRCIRRI